MQKAEVIYYLAKVKDEECFTKKSNIVKKKKKRKQPKWSKQNETKQKCQQKFLLRLKVGIIDLFLLYFLFMMYNKVLID